jgi:hypothetical protein
MGAGSRDGGRGERRFPCQDLANVQGPLYTRQVYPLGGEAPTFTPMPLVGNNTLPAEMPSGATKQPPETPGGAAKPPKGTERGEGGDTRYAAMKAVPKELVGNGAKRPSMSSNPDKRMWSVRQLMGMIGNDTLMARRYLSKSGQGSWKT